MTNEEIKALREQHGPLAIVTVDGTDHVFRKPSRPEWDDYCAAIGDKEVHLKAIRATIMLCCVSDTGALAACMNDKPFLVQGTGGFLTAVSKLAGQGSAEMRFV